MFIVQAKSIVVMIGDKGDVGEKLKSLCDREKISEAFPAMKGGGSAYGSASRPGKDFILFYIAPLDPVLKDAACGEHAGQSFTNVPKVLLLKGGF
ncbi:MAG TPA: hypothetical protein VE912_25145 [Bacteroidales bacterium]|nr:hypothetical protein [Bacteroidales bacterium]